MKRAPWAMVPDMLRFDCHVLPIGDLREHVAERDCWCKPKEDDEQPGLFVHNALDGRELVERGERRVQ